MPRVKLFNQEEALAKAMVLFWKKGYKATSLTDLTNDLDITKAASMILFIASVSYLKMHFNFIESVPFRIYSSC